MAKRRDHRAKFNRASAQNEAQQQDAQANDQEKPTPEASYKPKSDAKSVSEDAKSANGGSESLRTPEIDYSRYMDNVSPISTDDGFADLRGFDIPADSSIEDFLDENSEYGKLPSPEIFNEYPPELQRKIMEWTDRDVKARRDDESRRRDEVMRAEIDHQRRRQMFPLIITVLALICAAITGVVTANPFFPLVFLLVPLAVIAARVAGDDGSGGRKNNRNKPPKV